MSLNTATRPLRPIILGAIASLILTTPAQAQSFATTLALSAYATANVMDATTTMAVIATRQGREANPAMRSIVTRPLVFGAIKGGATVFTCWAMGRTAKKHPRFIQVTAWVAAGAYTAIAIHNARYLTRPK